MTPAFRGMSFFFFEKKCSFYYINTQNDQTISIKQKLNRNRNQRLVVGQNTGSSWFGDLLYFTVKTMVLYIPVRQSLIT